MSHKKVIIIALLSLLSALLIFLGIHAAWLSATPVENPAYYRHMAMVEFYGGCVLFFAVTYVILKK